MASPIPGKNTPTVTSSGSRRLRAHAIAWSLFRPTTLEAAIDRLGFVQADPIRSPARAQDLILRHRVSAYRAGDLERRYPSLEVEEGLLYAYGFLPSRAWRILHPGGTAGLSELEVRVLAAVRRHGAMHPGEMGAHFGSERVVNSWGGRSKATKVALERLHYHGLLRIARRENGIRIYEVAPSPVEALPPTERFAELVLMLAGVLAPVSEKTLQAVAARLRRLVPGVGDHRTVLRRLLKTGELESQATDGFTYLWPAPGIVHEEAPRRVRFLAPFDPLVWDRRRFEHLWRWSYRFEAYTPPARRLRGYYSMPLLWGDSIIGWANASVTGSGLGVELGFVDRRPGDPEFHREVEAEVARMEVFLDRDGTGSTESHGPPAGQSEEPTR